MRMDSEIASATLKALRRVLRVEASVEVAFQLFHVVRHDRGSFHVVDSLAALEALLAFDVGPGVVPPRSGTPLVI